MVYLATSLEIALLRGVSSASTLTLCLSTAASAEEVEVGAAVVMAVIAPAAFAMTGRRGSATVGMPAALPIVKTLRSSATRTKAVVIPTLGEAAEFVLTGRRVPVNAGITAASLTVTKMRGGQGPPIPPLVAPASREMGVRVKEMCVLVTGHALHAV